ncbi:MAG: GNAT family N-acetyltransferase [Bacteroidota bacterium]
MYFSPFPHLTSKRLELRELYLSDAPQIQFLRSDPTVNAHVVRPAPKDEEEAREFIRRIHQGQESGHFLFWAICLKEQASLIGTICLWHFSDDRRTAEVGYDLHPAHYKKGIMNEALQTVLSHSFGALQLSAVEAYTHWENMPSRKLLVRNGFVLLEEKRDPGNAHNIVFRLDKNGHQLTQAATP